MAIKHLKTDEFNAVVEAAPLAVVDFWAVWCGPCRMVAPIVEQIASEREDIVVGKINVDEEMELAVRFGIVSIPTLVVMKNGEMSNKAVGYMPKEKILNLL